MFLVLKELILKELLNSYLLRLFRKGEKMLRKEDNRTIVQEHKRKNGNEINKERVMERDRKK